MTEGEVPTGCVLRISDEKTLELLDLYRQEECLWNTENEYYKDQRPRKLAAEKIANLLKIPNFGPRHVMMKFKNLRNGYSQELKRIAKNAAVGFEYEPSVFWFHKMGFIQPHLKKSRQPHKRPEPPPSPPSVVFHVEGTETWLQCNALKETYIFSEIVETSENVCIPQRKRKSQTTPNTLSKIQKLDSDDDLQFVDTPASPTPPETERRNDSSVQHQMFTKDNIEGLPKSFIETVNDVSASLRALSSREEDVFERFGQYIAGMLRTLPHKKALQIQPQIVSLITAAGLDVTGDKEEVQGAEAACATIKEEKC